MKSVADILEHVCPCGGDPSAPQHQESLLHRQWLLGEGLRNGHDPVADLRDKERVWHVVPAREHHDLL